MIDHHSVRHYSDRQVSQQQLETIISAAQAASTSSNQNAWSVIVVSDPAVKTALMELTGGNPFIEQAPIFLVWLGDLGRNARLALQANAPIDALQYQEALLVATIDATLAAQNGAVAAESMGLGMCYVGGVRTRLEEVSDLLNLPDYVFPVVGMAVGYPSPDDGASVRPRLPMSAVAFVNGYDTEAADAGVDVLEDANRAYYETQGQPGVSWKGRAIARWKTTNPVFARAKNRERLARRGLPGN